MIFKGTFDGGGHTISNLPLDGSTSCKGLFGYVIGTVKDVTLKDVNCTEGTGGNSAVGCGVATNSIFSNCTVIGGTINGGKYTGVVCGKANSNTFSNCTVSNININGGEGVGGVCGYVDDDSDSYISKCCVIHTNINGGEGVGGVCGEVDDGVLSNIVDCTVSDTNINGGNKTGGVCGYFIPCNGRIEKCCFEGTVTGTDDVGGIVGNFGARSFNQINECFAQADVRGNIKVGGVSGVPNYGTISNCYFNGKLYGESEIGGISGSTSTNSAEIKILNCWAAGLYKGTGHMYKNGSTLCLMGGATANDAMCVCENCLFLGKYEGTGDPDIDVLANISAYYLKETIEYPDEKDPFIPGNDYRCYAREELFPGPGVGYDGMKLQIKKGWKEPLINAEKCAWSSEIWDFHEDSVALAPTLRNLNVEQTPHVYPYNDIKYYCNKENTNLVSQDMLGDQISDDLYDLKIDENYFKYTEGTKLKTLTSTNPINKFIGWVPKDDPTEMAITELAPTDSYSKIELVAKFQEDTPSTEEPANPDASAENTSGNNHPDWGEREIHAGIIHYVNGEGMTSVEISAENTDANGIVWLREESDSTAAWYGIDNSADTFAAGSRFYVQWLNPAEHPEAFADIDEETQHQVEENRGWLFKIGVIAPDGTRYSTLENPVNVYVQIGDDWDETDLQGFYIQQETDESVEVSYVEGMAYPEGTDNFGVMQLNHFSPYFIYDKDTEKDQNALNAVKTGDQLTYITISGLGLVMTLALGLMLKSKINRKNFDE